MSSCDDVNLGALLRAAADDELTPEQQARLDAHLAAHPEDAARIEFERRLRVATSRVMSDVRAPAGLRGRIERIGAEHEPRRPIWRQPRVVGLAASLLLVAGLLVVLSIPASPVGPQARYRATLMSFLDREHARCWVDTDTILDKFHVREPDELPQQAETLLGRSVSFDDFDDLEGLEFVGGGECVVPGRSPSMHLGFRTDGTRGEADVAVSLFVQIDPGKLAMQEGVTYRLTSERRIAREACTIYAWTHDGLLHFMVADNANACDLGRRALGAPETVEQL